MAVAVLQNSSINRNAVWTGNIVIYKQKQEKVANRYCRIRIIGNIEFKRNESKEDIFIVAEQVKNFINELQKRTAFILLSSMER